LSISFWIQTTSYQLQQVFYKVSPNTSLNETYSVPLNFTQEGTLNFDLKNNNCNPGQGWKYSSANIGSITSWTNFILTHDGLNTKFFKNGQLLNSTTGAFSISNCPGGDLLFGCDWQFKNKLNGIEESIKESSRATRL
jgi:predicted chitinase